MKLVLPIADFKPSIANFTGGCGEIGRHARLRIWCFTAWGFESLHPHNRTEEQMNREQMNVEVVLRFIGS